MSEEIATMKPDQGRARRAWATISRNPWLGPRPSRGGRNTQPQAIGVAEF